MQKCPIYKSSTACDENPDCLFLRQGGCAIVLAATITEENSQKIEDISSQLDDIQRKLSEIVYHLQNRS